MACSILHVDLDAFFVSVEQALEPALRDKPVVVGGNPQGRGVVASASYEARAYGLCAGMPLATAYRLCPQAIFLQGNFSRYQEASERFIDILARFTPFIEVSGIDEAYLDITGFDALHGSARQLACNLKQAVSRELGITASVGIATSKVVAKVASDLCKPDGLMEVAPGEEAVFLAPLPVAKLPGVGPKTEQRLKGIGIHSIGQLANLSASFVRYVLGRGGGWLHSCARGVDPRKIELPAAAKSISRATTFARDTLSSSFLKANLCYLSQRVGAELRQQRKAARCITLKLRYADFQTITRSRTLKEAVDIDQVIFQTGCELLEKAVEHRGKLVRLIGIGVSRLVAAGRQLSFEDESATRLEQLNHAIDGLRQKYGFTCIQTGQTLLLQDFLPVAEGHYVLATPALSR